MRKQTGGGAIVNESSLASLKGIPDNALCPSAIDGAMLRGFMAHRGFSEEKMASLVPIGRIGKPEDVAEAVLFVCSEKASYITGATLEVDGGMSAG